MDGEVSAVRADEFGADMNGSWKRRSWGDTVARLDMELEALPPKSKTLGTAGEEKAVLAPPSKAVNSSSSTSRDGERGQSDRDRGDKPAAFIILAVCWILPVLWEKRGTGGLAGVFCCGKVVDDEGAEEA